PPMIPIMLHPFVGLRKTRGNKGARSARTAAPHLHGRPASRQDASKSVPATRSRRGDRVSAETFPSPSPPERRDRATRIGHPAIGAARPAARPRAPEAHGHRVKRGAYEP